MSQKSCCLEILPDVPNREERTTGKSTEAMVGSGHLSVVHHAEVNQEYLGSNII